MSRYSVEYLEQLLAKPEYDALVELQGILLGWPSIDVGMPDYGAPAPAFALIEALTWFAQAIRSGAWTYFEATSLERQRAMLAALKVLAPIEFAEMYQLGMRCWRDTSEMKKLDRWLADNDSACNAWLRKLMQLHMEKLAPMFD